MPKFVDRVQVKVKGGNGGKGCMSFRREKFVPKGGPDGGDGGNGGDVIFEATTGESSLVDLLYMNHYEGEKGQHGMGKQRHGKNGADVVIKVPVGTLIKDAEDTSLIMADLAAEGEQYVAARGGRGGRGNLRFVSSVNRAPRRTDPGEEGEERELELELKIIADVGLVGYPNAGKSTFLTEVSNAHPEVAPYPFTTITPNVGIVDYEDFTRLTIADIPGLIEGAHENVGLGHDFLRHIERTKVLVYVLDMAGTDDRSPLDDLASLKSELEWYQEGLSERARLIIANKMDDPVATDNLAKLQETVSLPVFPVCAVLREGVQPVLDHLRELIPVE